MPLNPGAGMAKAQGVLVSTDERAWTRDKVEFLTHPYDPEHPTAGNGPLALQFAELTRALLDAPTVADVLEQVVWAALRVVPGADLVSITLRSPDGAFHTPVETEPVAAELDQLQYDTGEGPCVEAARASGPACVSSDNFATEPAWPRFGPAAAERGFIAVLSTALLPDARLPWLSGALNIYARQPDTLRAEGRDFALLLATHASLALAGTQAVTQAELQEVQLRKAIDSRDVIGQAKGILMQRRGITAAEAFDLLRGVSQELNIKLAKLAKTLATHHTELHPRSRLSPDGTGYDKKIT
ncbi:MAG: GAF and ANTAR domain-containing protein [Sciscionella sp.]